MAQPDYILVMGLAYGELERLDDFKIQGQSFAIRFHDNVHLENHMSFPRLQKVIHPSFRTSLASWGHRSVVSSNVIV
ncbi:hypothetical protein [Paenibacillus terrae]|uniref:hypothetical protein n=1 Tax=Paenibacillus terrae TaxID=159743 RepID=UPI0011EACBBB|nr:hypothetical protein [Paenibacillus terrae]